MVATERLADILVGELAATFPRQRLLGAWLYGSRARGEARADSDLDLAVLCDGPLDPVAEPMRRMVGFRNVAVHDYRRLDPVIVRTVVEHRLGDFEALCRELLAA
jgi:predicted nucleotidyltransferase